MAGAPLIDMITISDDPLSHVEVEVACNICGDSYSVSGSTIRESQRLLAQGCTGTSLFECDAAFYATLLEPEVIAELERAWARLETDLERWENEGGR
jgi:hypothetical protein